MSGAIQGPAPVARRPTAGAYQIALQVLIDGAGHLPGHLVSGARGLQVLLEVDALQRHAHVGDAEVVEPAGVGPGQQRRGKARAAQPAPAHARAAASDACAGHPDRYIFLHPS